ncbi:MAG: ribonuclease [Lachnospiraceae bacterium]|nr:ribonuclease [Lachnospiraceae bacterium]
MTIVSLYKISRAFSRKIREDYVSAFAAQAALFVIISFFPFTMLLLTVIQYLPITESTMLATLTNIFPTTLNPFIINVVTEIYNKGSGTIVSITAITTLWSASRGILAIVKGLNSVYGINETRSYLKLRILSTFYTLIFAIMLIVTLVILVFGNRLYIWIEQRFSVLKDLALIIISMRTFVGLCILTLFFLLMFVAIPNRKTHILQEFPGALVASAGWMGFSYLFSFYIDNMGNYSNTYGSLTVVVLFMLWFYSCMYILFIGGEVNIVLSSGDLGYFLKQLFLKKNDSKVKKP